MVEERQEDHLVVLELQGDQEDHLVVLELRVDLVVLEDQPYLEVEEDLEDPVVWVGRLQEEVVGLQEAVEVHLVEVVELPCLEA